MTICAYSQCDVEFEPKRPHHRFHHEGCRYADFLERQENGSEDGGQRVGDGVGSRGGNVRDLDTARELQSQVKDKRDWRDAIDEQIRLTLLETGYFHADDLDEIRVPPDHAQLKGTRSAWFRNQGFMEKTGAERKVSHKAANGRKAAIHRITPKGRRELTVGHRAGGRGEPGPENRTPARVVECSAANATPSSVSGEQSTAGVDVSHGAASLQGAVDSTEVAGIHPGDQSAAQVSTGAPSPQGSDGATNKPDSNRCASADPGETPSEVLTGASEEPARLFDPPPMSAITNQEAA